ncbi:SRPBCC domain-containing protein [Streptomyces sp. NPDC051217]|uniref:SRPBCC domain-containing protein n=1 Tax=Streptomyces sp. NPDC051217 TaxID=3365644 RepID=UPI00379E0A8E
MEHEVFIPVPAETLREALRDHARVARCVPGLQQDADGSARPLSGRLKVRVGGHTITYRGALTLTERAGGFTAKGEGSEVRGTGSAKLNVRVGLTETADGTTLTFTATSTSEGRLSEIDGPTSEATARRLLDRFAAALTKGDASGLDGADASGGAAGSSAGAVTASDDTSAADSGGGAGAAAGNRPDASGVGAGAGGGRDDDVTAPAADSGGGEGAAAAGRPAESRGVDGAGEPVGGGDQAEPADRPAGPSGSGQDRDVTASGDDDGDAAHAADAADDAPDADLPDLTDPDLGEPEGFDPSVGFGATSSGDGDFLVPLDPPAEAAHARRTMIGRSAEEVDHAPPRGRYAPEQAPESGGAGAALRWVAPAAALAIAGAVVVGRALRRRR